MVGRLWIASWRAARREDGMIELMPHPKEETAHGSNVFCIFLT
jgi:hypothetical protein